MADSNEDFIPGGAIISNMEDYSLIVHREADQYAAKVRKEADDYKLEIEKGVTEAIEKKRQAEDQAARILAEAEEKAESLRQNAEEQGRQAGKDAAYQEYNLEFKSHLTSLASVAEEIEKIRQEVGESYEQEIVKICLMMAKVVLKSEISLREDVVLESLKKVIKKTQDLGKVKIYLNPVDLDFVRQNSDQLQRWLVPDQFLQILDSEEVKPGGAQIETDFTKIDLDIAEQVKKLDQFFADLLPARQAAKQRAGQKT